MHRRGGRAWTVGAGGGAGAAHWASKADREGYGSRPRSLSSTEAGRVFYVERMGTLSDSTALPSDMAVRGALKARPSGDVPVAKAKRSYIFGVMCRTFISPPGCGTPQLRGNSWPSDNNGAAKSIIFATKTERYHVGFWGGSRSVSSLEDVARVSWRAFQGRLQKRISVRGCWWPDSGRVTPFTAPTASGCVRVAS